jgi:hypothetical protein
VDVAGPPRQHDDGAPFLAGWNIESWHELDIDPHVRAQEPAIAQGDLVP